MTPMTKTKKNMPPTDEAEANSSEEEGVSRGGTKKKEDEVGSKGEHEFDDAIGTIYYV